MWKACSRCGKVHPSTYACHIGVTATPEMRLRSTSRWKRKREQIKEASNYLCAVCREEGRYIYEGIEVHHITKLRDRPDLLLDDDNLIPLCVTHHKMADEGKIDPDYLRKLARRRDVGETPLPTEAER